MHVCRTRFKCWNPITPRHFQSWLNVVFLCSYIHHKMEMKRWKEQKTLHWACDCALHAKQEVCNSHTNTHSVLHFTRTIVFKCYQIGLLNFFLYCIKNHFKKKNANNVILSFIRFTLKRVFHGVLHNVGLSWQQTPLIKREGLTKKS